MYQLFRHERISTYKTCLSRNFQNTRPEACGLALTSRQPCNEARQVDTGVQFDAQTTRHRCQSCENHRIQEFESLCRPRHPKNLLRQLSQLIQGIAQFLAAFWGEATCQWRLIPWQRQIATAVRKGEVRIVDHQSSSDETIGTTIDTSFSHNTKC